MWLGVKLCCNDCGGRLVVARTDTEVNRSRGFQPGLLRFMCSNVPANPTTTGHRLLSSEAKAIANGDCPQLRLGDLYHNRSNRFIHVMPAETRRLADLPVNDIVAVGSTARLDQSREW